MEEEKKYLKFVQEQIAIERKNQTESLIQIPKQYKGRYADVKWGDEDLVKNLTEICLKRLKILDNLEKNPYFGRFEFIELGDHNLKKYYIGKTDLYNDSKMLVLDWRNPICTLYYDQSIGPVSYMAPIGEITGELIRKSQILIKDGELVNIRDVDLVSDDELLQPYLSVNADNRMKVIIASIQAEQNEIIRKSFNQNIIIQGVAGSGKTSVALHRIAYLLYNLGNEYDASKFVIIGPNKYFLNYVSSILPDLDTQTIEEYTFEEIAKEIIEEEKYVYESSNDEMNRHLKSKNEYEQAKRFKGTLQYKECLIHFLNNYFDSHFKDSIEYEGIEIISGESLKSGINCNMDYFQKINTFIQMTSKRIKENWEEIYYELTKPLMLEMKKYGMGTIERKEVIEKMEQLKILLKKGFLNELKKYVKPLLISPINLYKLFLENIEKYIKINPEDLKYFKEETLAMLKKKIIPYEDLAAISYLSMIRNGCKGYEKYKEVVIDEAQDYSLFQFNLLKLLFKESHFSIFGDLAQAIYAYRSIDSWDDVITTIFNSKCEFLHMNKSYRTTKEITDISNLVLDHLNLEKAEPVIRTGKEVQFDLLTNSKKNTFYPTKILEFVKKGFKSVGIICKTEEEMEDVAKILNRFEIPFNYIKNSDKEYAAGVCVLTSYLAKGLEFDGVIINDASESNFKSNSVIDMHLLYVATTRALHELVVMYNDKLCNAFTSIYNKDQSTKELVLVKKGSLSNSVGRQ